MAVVKVQTSDYIKRRLVNPLLEKNNNKVGDNYEAELKRKTKHNHFRTMEYNNLRIYASNTVEL